MVKYQEMEASPIQYKNRTLLFILRNIHILILGVSALLSSFALSLIMSFDTSRLNVFGPTAKIYFSGIKNGLISSTTILIVSLVFFIIFRKKFDHIKNYLKTFFASLSNFKKNLLILLICLVFAFATHSGGIINGYFNMDDFEIIALNHTLPFGESLLIPHGNDHTMPLFIAEMKGLDFLFGQRALPYNLFFFALFALIPFFTYLIFSRLKLSVLSFFLFLIIFTGATGWADILSGFNIMTTYMQIVLFFSIAIFSYLKWTETKEYRYMAVFSLATIFAVTVDLPGIWTIPSIFLFIFYFHWQNTQQFEIKIIDIKAFIQKNVLPLSLLITTVILFAIFFYITFNILHPGTFLSTLNGGETSSIDEKATYWKLDLLASNFFSLFSFGVSLPIFLPNIDKLLAHPSLIYSVKLLWPMLKWIIVALNATLFWFVFKYADLRLRKLTVFLLAIMFITITMVIVARPDHEVVPNFDYRYAGPTFYAYSIFIALFATLFLKIKGGLAVKIIIPTAILIISLNQAFGFQASRLEEEAKLRKDATIKVNVTLLQELSDLTKKSGPLTIPNLSGANIFEGMQGYTLADYVLFFNRKTPLNLVRNAEMQPDVKTHTVKTVDSLRADTSKEFVNELKKPGAIRAYYAFPSLMRYKNINGITESSTLETAIGSGEIVVEKSGFDPGKKSTVSFSLYTDDTPGNLELFFTFTNDFDATEKAGRIRIDDYTPRTTEGGRRAYHVETNLLQLYTFSLSKTISNLTLYVPETKNAFVKGVVFR